MIELPDFAICEIYRIEVLEHTSSIVKDLQCVCDKRNLKTTFRFTSTFREHI